MLKILNSGKDRRPSVRNMKPKFVKDSSEVNEILTSNMVRRNSPSLLLNNITNSTQMNDKFKTSMIELLKSETSKPTQKTTANNYKIIINNGDVKRCDTEDEITIKSSKSILGNKSNNSSSKHSVMNLANVQYKPRKSTKDRLPNIMTEKIKNRPIQSSRMIPYVSVGALKSSRSSKQLQSRKQSIMLPRQSRQSHINPEKVAEVMRNSEKNSEYTKYLKRKIRLDIAISIFLCLNLLMSIIDNEIYIDYTDKFLNTKMQDLGLDVINEEILNQIDQRELNPLENWIRGINGVICFISAILIVFRYKAVLKIDQIDQKLSKYDNLFNSNIYIYMIFEVFICLIFYPPFLRYILTGKQIGFLYSYSINSVISIVVLIKFYLICRIFMHYSRWTSDNAVSFCNKYKVKNGIHFAIKSEMKKRPFTVLSFLLVFLMVIFGFAMRTFEYGVFNPVHKSKGMKGSNDLQNLANCFWLIIVTMTTVGFGDYYPISHPGRFVGVLACFIGMMLLSLIVVSLGVITEFSLEEKKAFSKLKKLFADDNMENKASNVVRNVLLLRKFIIHLNSKKKHYYERDPGSLSERFILFTQLKKEISIFKNDYKIANSHSLPVDEVLFTFQTKLENDLNKLSNNIELIDGFNNELTEITEGQENIQVRIRNVIEMQDEIGAYIIYLNNENYIKNLKVSKINIKEDFKINMAAVNDFEQNAITKLHKSITKNKRNLNISNLSNKSKKSKKSKNARSSKNLISKDVNEAKTMKKIEFNFQNKMLLD